MSRERFNELVGEIAGTIAGRPLDASLAGFLNRTYPVDAPVFAELRALCEEGEENGWLMSREAGGIKFGRAVKPGQSAGDFSVDVVRMKDVRGPHHIHPNGEIGAVLGISGVPTFDAFTEGWYVYGPGSDHHPTVSGGDAYVLYLLPNGAIEFTGH
ncbi:hypothetical protein MesoLjLc_01290 [Mesorhizobium sp. L-8-10]|uniref:4-hydroxylaminobenzoate lyase n=1 Tax=unclassified Mesorhizobium TaxID=325217 RepID=UPI00192911DC|nr:MULTISPECIES: DUF4863 family protein [unclassified Mesorhizobium]BCH20345.1 hypothetical protein MesoLjLb_01300 [Mesorhizobium sp. L-8-3]BCH28199.1 hypothetical protein MesoLjLc_01290 [Mesorhizobium sp. L-8-10]